MFLEVDTTICLTEDWNPICSTYYNSATFLEKFCPACPSKIPMAGRSLSTGYMAVIPAGRSLSTGYMAVIPAGTIMTLSRCDNKRGKENFVRFSIRYSPAYPTRKKLAMGIAVDFTAARQLKFVVIDEQVRPVRDLSKTPVPGKIAKFNQVFQSHEQTSWFLEINNKPPELYNITVNHGWMSGVDTRIIHVGQFSGGMLSLEVPSHLGYSLAKDCIWTLNQGPYAKGTISNPGTIISNPIGSILCLDYKD